MNNDLRETIFIVDDKDTNLLAGRTALEGIYNVLTINSGARLFKMLEKRIPDLILLDVKMPEMNGYEILKKLKSDIATSEIPVIFLTALNSDATELEGLALGAIDYISKPFSAPLLLKRIELHLLVVSQKNNLEKLVQEKVKTIIELKNSILKTMAELVEYRDTTTGNHICRTQGYIKVLIDEMKRSGLYENEIFLYDEELLLQSCQLHDVGKIAVKDSILLKQGKLTKQEFEEMKLHTTFGEKIIWKIKEDNARSDFLEYARIFAVSHHEKWNGEGYPYGLKGLEIPLLGRIMAIADVYDALVSLRPYKREISHEEAVKIIINGKGTHFDPVLIDLFGKINHDFRSMG